MGDTLTIGNSSVSQHNYSWLPSSGLSNDTIANPALIVDSTVTYIITDTDEISGCFSTDTIVISSLTLPVIGLVVDTGMCIGDSIQLIAGGGTTYSWTPSSSLVNATVIHPATVNLSTTTQFIFTVTDQTTSCISLPDTVVITITGGPLSIALIDDTICNGESVNLNAVVSGGSGTYTHSWISVPSGFTSTNPNPSVSPSTTTIYIDSVNDGFNFVIDSLVIVVNPLPRDRKSVV